MGLLLEHQISWGIQECTEMGISSQWFANNSLITVYNLGLTGVQTGVNI